MSRRDTIIVAVLVNAALLMVLFATALRSDRAGEPKKPAAQLAKSSKAEAPPREDLLNQYITAVPSLNEPDSLGHELILDEEELPLALAPVDVPAPKGQESISGSAEKYVSITVKQGDFLEKIAKANNTTVAAIMQANQLNTTQLKIGQVLKVPVSGKPASSARSAQPLSDVDYYVVQEGDSPWLIASRNSIKLSDLLRLNDLDEQKARRIRPGDKLRIR